MNTVALGAICKLVGGTGFPELMQGKPAGDFPFYKVGDISENWKSGNVYLSEANHYIDAADVTSLRAKPLPRDAVVFAKIGAAIGLNRRAITSCESLVDNNVFALVAQPERLNTRYLFHFMCSVDLLPLARATTVPSLRKGDVEGLKLPLPPLPTQHRIVQALEEKLSRLDAAQSALLRAQANLKRYRASVLHSQFQLDFPGAALGSLGKWFGGGTPSKSNSAFWVDGTIPWVSPKDMKVFRISTAEDTITETACTQSSTSRVKRGSVLMVARSGILQHTLPIAIAEVDVTINQDLKALEPRAGVSAVFVAYALKAHENHILHNYTKEGTTVLNINFTEFKTFEIPLPPLKTQHRIVAEVERHLSLITRTEQSLQTQLSRAKRLRQSILQQAFSVDAIDS